MLTDKECSALAVAATKVSEQYDHNINPKVIAWLHLAAVAGGVYGTRIYAIHARLKSEGGGKPPKIAEAKNVVEMKAGGSGKVAETPARAQTPADIFGLGYSAAIPDLV